MLRFLLIAIFSCFLHAGFSQAQYVGFRIDSAVRAEMQARQIPGMQMVVIKYGVVIKKGRYGFANLEDRVPVTDSTLFSIATMSNAFTAAAILLLMEDGKLGIDDPVGKYFDSPPGAWNDMTLRMLMNRTAGLRDDWDADENYFWTKNSDSAMLAALKETKSKFLPGEGYSYGCGPFLLGLIIEKVSGETYPDFMKHRIFDKLGMKNSRINNPEEIIPNRAAGYRLQNGQLLKGHQVAAAAQARGDMGVLTTVTDMQKWYSALQDSSLLQKESLKMMFSPGILNDGHKTPYGLGWFLDPYRDRALVYHAGEFRTGFNSVMEFYPEDGVCIIILGNLHRAAVIQIAKIIVGLFSADYGLASRMDTVADPDTVRTLLLKSDFTEIGLNVDTARKRAREMHLRFYPEYDSQLAGFRNVEEFTFIRSIKPKNPKADIFGDTIQGIYLYRVKCRDSAPHYIAFFLNPAGKLVYMNYEE